jgi:hypothetical protein
VYCVAPVPHDVSEYRRQLENALIDVTRGKATLGKAIQQFLNGSRRTLGGGGNPLSLAITVRWRNVGVLLAGDVESSTEKESGWAGIMAVLTEDNAIHLLQRMNIVKVAHHGSEGAYHAPAWDLHCDGRSVAVAALAPFARGKNPPPHDSALTSIRTHADHLAITTRPRPGWGVVPSRHWSLMQRKITAIGDLPVVALELKQRSLRMLRGTAAHIYR